MEQKAMEKLDARKVGDVYIYRAGETGEYYTVTKTELDVLSDMLTRNPSTAYSEWCAMGHGERLTAITTNCPACRNVVRHTITQGCFECDSCGRFNTMDELIAWAQRIGASVTPDCSEQKRVARIFEECTGKYHLCDDAGPLDARGRAHDSKADALRAAARDGYTHAVGSGCPWDGCRRIPARYRES